MDGALMHGGLVSHNNVNCFTDDKNGLLNYV